MDQDSNYYSSQLLELMHIIYESFGKFCLLREQLHILFAFKANVSLVDKVLLLTPLTDTKAHRK